MSGGVGVAWGTFERLLDARILVGDGMWGSRIGAAQGMTRRRARPGGRCFPPLGGGVCLRGPPARVAAAVAMHWAHDHTPQKAADLRRYGYAADAWVIGTSGAQSAARAVRHRRAAVPCRARGIGRARRPRGIGRTDRTGGRGRTVGPVTPGRPR